MALLKNQKDSARIENFYEQVQKCKSDYNQINKEKGQKSILIAEKNGYTKINCLNYPIISKKELEIENVDSIEKHHRYENMKQLSRKKQV